MKRKILYYISSHGYGHAARAGQVVGELLSEYDVHIKTTAPAWLLENIIGREVPLYRETYDVGCVQRNNMDVDEGATVSSYLNQSKNNFNSLAKEVDFVRNRGFDLILSDIASFPFLVAREASLPSIFIGNFTWNGIYSAFDSCPENILDELEKQYGSATLSLITPLAMEMPELKNKKRISLIARKGRNVRDNLNKEFNIPKNDRLVFLYPGNRGFEEIDPANVQKAKECTFISFYPIEGPLTNHIQVESDTYRHQDIMASSDMALIKPGYGMISEAMVNETPFIYPPREEFCEYFAFLKEFQLSGGSLLIEREDYECGNWINSIEKILDHPYRKRYLSSGAKECRDEVDRLLALAL